MKFLLSALFATAVQEANATVILKKFQKPIAVTDDLGVNYGTLSGITSWVRGGYGPSASLDCIFELHALGPSLIPDPVPEVTEPAVEPAAEGEESKAEDAEPAAADAPDDTD